MPSSWTFCKRDVLTDLFETRKGKLDDELGAFQLAGRPEAGVLIFLGSLVPHGISPWVLSISSSHLLTMKPWVASIPSLKKWQTNVPKIIKCKCKMYTDFLPYEDSLLTKSKCKMPISRTLVYYPSLSVVYYIFEKCNISCYDLCQKRRVSIWKEKKENHSNFIQIKPFSKDSSEIATKMNQSNKTWAEVVLRLSFIFRMIEFDGLERNILKEGMRTVIKLTKTMRQTTPQTGAFHSCLVFSRQFLKHHISPPLSWRHHQRPCTETCSELDGQCTPKPV